MIVHDDIDQRSPEWQAIRLGKLTGSRANDMLATKQSKGEAAARRNLRVALALERITGRSQERTFVSQAMQDGVDREDPSRGLYEALTGRLIQTSGFCDHDTLQAGCSVDGHFNDFEGILELKNPTPAIHLEYLQTGIVPLDYQRQVVHNLWITGAQWCDWVSHNPEFPEKLQTRIVTIPRDDKALAAYGQLAEAFLREVDEQVAAIRRMA